MPYTLVNCSGRFNCYPAAVQMARRHAKRLNVPILVLYHGPRHNKSDPRTVSFYVMPNGNVHHTKVNGGFDHPPEAAAKLTP